MNFDRDVSTCAASVAPFDSPYTVLAEPRLNDVTGVYVRILNSAETDTNVNCYLTVTC